MHQTQRWPAVGHPAVEACDEAPADLLMLGHHPLAVSLDERCQQLRYKRLVEDVCVVQPRRRPELGVGEHRSMQLRELLDRQAGLLDAAAADLVALDGWGYVLQQEREPSPLDVYDGEMASCEWTSDPRCEVAIEADLAVVDP